MEKLSNADIENILVRTMAKYKGYVRRGDDATISTGEWCGDFKKGA